MHKYTDRVLWSWAHAGKHADFYLLLDKFDGRPFAPWLASAANIRPVVRRTLVADLAAFARVVLEGDSSRQVVVDPHALSSLKPALADFATSVLGLKLSKYSHFGYVEVDVVMSDLECWVLPS